MKFNVVIIIAVIVLSNFLPLTLQIPLSSAEQGKYYVSLDVCHASDSFVPASSDVPCLYEFICNPLTVETKEVIETSYPSFVSHLFSRQIDQPPKNFS